MKSPVDLKDLKLALRDQMCADCEHRVPDDPPAPQKVAAQMDAPQGAAAQTDGPRSKAPIQTAVGEQVGRGELAPPVAAKCESECALFTHLPRLARVAQEGEPPCGFEVFAKSLQNSSGQAHVPNIVHALTIIEAAALAAPKKDCNDEPGCKREERIAAQLECLDQKPLKGSD
jgi:hypothetical protein